MQNVKDEKLTYCKLYWKK